MVILLTISTTIVWGQAQCDKLKKDYDSKMAEFTKIQNDMKKATAEADNAKYNELNVQYNKTWKEASQLKKDWQSCEDESKNKHKKAYNDGLKLKKDGNKAGALAKFQAAIKDDPEFEDAYYAACVVMLDMKKYENFDAYVAKIKDKDKKGALMMNKAGNLSDANNYNEAIKAFNETAKFYKADKAYYRIGMIYHEKMFDYNSAVNYLNKSIVADPKDPKVYEALGVAYMELKSTQEAINAFEKGAKINDKMYKNYAILYYRLAQAYNILGKSKNALEYANKSIAANKNKQFGPAYFEKGQALKKMGSIGEAKSAFEAAKGDMISKKQAEYELEQLKNKQIYNGVNYEFS